MKLADEIRNIKLAFDVGDSRRDSIEDLAKRVEQRLETASAVDTIVMEPGCKCQECAKIYTVDFIVPDNLWEQIKPTNKAKGAGLLCGICIAKKIENIKGFAAFELRVP